MASIYPIAAMALFGWLALKNNGFGPLSINHIHKPSALEHRKEHWRDQSYAEQQELFDSRAPSDFKDMAWNEKRKRDREHREECIRFG